MGLLRTIVVRLIIASTLCTSTLAQTRSPPQYCGIVFDKIKNNDEVLLEASEVFECLRSVPFNDAVATRFVKYINTTMQFQSTLAYLRDPPPEYQQPAIDVLQGLEFIQQNVTGGRYNNQYAFEADLQRLFIAMHDAHVVLNAGLLSPFTFGSLLPISSVSVDGRQEPQVFFTDDITGYRDNPDAGKTPPSPISSINERDTAEFLAEFAALNSIGMLEPHADWNTLMTTPQVDMLGRNSVFHMGATFYPGGGDLNFAFANGSFVNTTWYAYYNYPYDTGPLATGGDYYNYFVLGIPPASLADPQAVEPPADDVSSGYDLTPPTVGSWYEPSYGAYPQTPDVVQEDLSLLGGGVVSGYFLEDASLGVLSIPSFQQARGDLSAFSRAVAEFVERAKNEWRVERVVIDLQGNRGGDVALALEVMGRFFPDLMPFLGSRRRIHELANALGTTTTAVWEQLRTEDPEEYGWLASDEWVITPRLNAETEPFQNFTSWGEYAAPRTERGDTFSLVETYNLTDTAFSNAAFEGIFPYSFSQNNPSADYRRPWAAENVVIVTDGTCSSACALFVEMMSYEASVRTVVFGGRPSGQGVPAAMQAAAGSRGARAYSADYIDADLEYAEGAGLPHQNRETGIYTIFAGFNLRDQVRRPERREEGEGTDVPLQFRYLPANCRLYYTLANAYDMGRQWRDVAAAMFPGGDPSACVGGASSNATAPPAAAAKIQFPSAANPELVNPDGGVSLLTDDPSAGLSASYFLPAKGEITICSPEGTCNPNFVCEEVSYTCPDSPVTPQSGSGCLQRCRSSELGLWCAGADSKCEPQRVIPRKDAFGGSRLQVYEGTCRPTGPTRLSACPAGVGSP